MAKKWRWSPKLAGGGFGGRYARRFALGLAAIGLFAGCSLFGGGRKELPPMPKEQMPYFWPYPDVPEPKWPAAHPEARYREGMSGEQYFKHLCQLESGDFISRTVPDVESLYFVRLQGGLKNDAAVRRDVPEDPFTHQQGLDYSGGVSHAIGDNLPRYLNQPAMTLTRRKYYRFVEAPQPYFRRGEGIPNAELLYEWGELKPLSDAEIAAARPKPGSHEFLWRTRRSGDGTKYVRVERNPTEVTRLRRYPRPGPNNFTVYSQQAWYELRYTDEIRSRYGVLWRGIQRPRDREFDIAGSELIVLDLTTNEILGVSRGFVRGIRVPPGETVGTAVLWSNSTMRCPVEIDNFANRFPVSPWEFIRKVLQPVEQTVPTPIEELAEPQPLKF